MECGRDGEVDVGGGGDREENKGIKKENKVLEMDKDPEKKRIVRKRGMSDKKTQDQTNVLEQHEDHGSRSRMRGGR
jgi:hypothetical protein